MIKVEGCRACGRTLYLGEIAPGTTVRTETVPLEADAAVQALLGGASLWRVMWLGGRPSRLSTAGPAVLAKLRTEPGSRPVVVEEHRCPVSAQEALSQPLKGRVVPGDPKGLPSSPVGHQTPSWGRREASCSVRSADHARSEPFEIDWSRVGGGERCPNCGIRTDRDAVALADLTRWADHLDNCS